MSRQNAEMHNKKRDAAIFRKTASTTRSVNIKPVMRRGGRRQ